MKFLVLFLFILAAPVCFGQTVTNQKEAEKIYKDSLEENKNAKAYYAEDEKCRVLLRMKSYADAEISCKRAVAFAEKLPQRRYLDKATAYERLGIAFLGQQKADGAILYFNKALEARGSKPDAAANASDAGDSEIGDLYFLIGQANHLSGKIDQARESYTKAENIYRAAFKHYADTPEVAGDIPPVIKNILETHLVLVENAGLKEEAEKIKQRLALFTKEFAEFL